MYVLYSVSNGVHRRHLEVGFEIFDNENEQHRSASSRGGPSLHPVPTSLFGVFHYS
jgi:hypothetical protein